MGAVVGAPIEDADDVRVLQAGRADEAEAVYWEDLRNNPGNGWSLRGLMQALEAQGKKDDAARVRARLAEAWKFADTETSADLFQR